MAVVLTPYLSYRDASAAITWLEAIGFQLVTRQDDAEGAVLHAELRWDDAVVMLAGDDQPYSVAPLIGISTGAGVYLVVDDVDAVYSLAVGAGATAVLPPEETEWGSRRARVIDPGGREWSFGSYRPGFGW
ncbi:VOC family protein [Protaetiibacter mangrovi]|uniref:Bleomycin resistance protein n=1 Tax=Protaetiibacter mangrovi TaxID=2970926 RepID=A0ABT1ZIL2_9MICO|nr:VOC family protein [Protaetiibacter mangrovi]MCS0500554.1 bleomycin resistance protein [Protaetiibacter mangrovi]